MSNVQQMESGQERHSSSLEACVLYVLEQIGHPIPQAHLLSLVSNPEGRLTIEDTLRIAAQAGLLSAFGKRPIDAFDSSLAPAILFLKSERAVVLLEVSKDYLVVFDPEFSDQLSKISVSKIRDAYSGFTLLLRPNHSEDITGTNKHKGHWFWSALAASRWSYFQVIMAAMLTSILGLTTSIFTMVVYDRILPNEATESLIALTAGVGIALIFDFLIKMLRSSFIDRAGEKADLLMGRRVFDQLIDLRLAARQGSSGALSNTLREFETLRDFVTSASLVAIVDLPFTALFIFVIYQIGGPLAYIPLTAVPLVLLVGASVQPFLVRLSNKTYKDGQNKQTVIVETLNGIETIKATGSARYMRRRWETAISQQARHSGQSRAITQFALNGTAFIQQTAQIAIIVYGVFLISEGVTSMGALIASVILTGRTLAPMAQLAQTLTRMNNARVSFRSLNSIMNADVERPEDRVWISRPRLEGNITFDNVHFTYPGEMIETLKGVSFEVKPGEKVAILGPIGSGKSTIARMLLNLYQPDSGAVRVDGVDIRQIDPTDLRRNIGAALQNSWLFSGSLRDNLAIGSLRPSDKEILEAARIAGVEDFVARHPLGYDMHVGEKGEGLSGGQMQTICLARALVGQPSILLLDEPTSSLDIQTERDVILNLKRHLNTETVIVITHRTSMLDLVDRVIVIDDGKVTVDGPKDLLKRTRPNTAQSTKEPRMEQK